MIRALLRLLGYGLCHQLPERSFFGGGIQVPVCARDTGIYLGFIVSLVILAVMHRGNRPREFPSLPVWGLLAVLVGFMGWDGVTSYAGLRESNNLLRLVTGLCTGFSVAVVVLPLLNDTLWAHPGSGRILSSPGKVLGWLAGIPVTALVVWWLGPAAGAAYPVVVGISIIVTLTAVNMVLVGTFPWFDRAATRVADLASPALLGLILSLAEIAMSGLLRLWLVRLAG